MTARQESMPMLISACARWDADASKIRYFASFEGHDGKDEWIEVPVEDFDHLTRLFAQEAIGVICYEVSSTLDHVKSTLGEFTAFREGLEKLSQMTKPASPGTGN